MDEIIKKDINIISNEINQFKEKIEGKKILITGGAGFLGSWFCDILNSFDAEIICVDNLSSGHENNIKHLIDKSNFNFINSDIDSCKIDEKIDYIVHMASIATPSLYMDYPIETLDSNIIGTKKLLELSKKNKIKGFLLTSTSEIYGNPSDENVPTKENFYGIVNSFGPRSMYDEGKRAAESYCYSYFKKFGLKIRIARIFNTYGPRLDMKETSQYGRAIIKFIHQSINNNPITVYGDGEQTRSFCYITDQITGLFKLLFTPNIDGEVFNIGNDIETSIIDLARIVIKSLNSNSKVILNSPSNYDLKDDPRRRCPDISKAKFTFEYYPKVTLRDGIIKTANWMKNNL